MLATRSLVIKVMIAMIAGHPSVPSYVRPSPVARTVARPAVPRGLSMGASWSVMINYDEN